MKLLTAAAAAERLGVTPRAVTGYCQQGLLKHERFGKAYLIREADLTAFRKPVVGWRKGRSRKPVTHPDAR
jgi:excisionase family DNA binding protein